MMIFTDVFPFDLESHLSCFCWRCLCFWCHYQKFKKNNNCLHYYPRFALGFLILFRMETLYLYLSFLWFACRWPVVFLLGLIALFFFSVSFWHYCENSVAFIHRDLFLGSVLCPINLSLS